MTEPIPAPLIMKILGLSVSVKVQSSCVFCGSDLEPGRSYCEACEHQVLRKTCSCGSRGPCVHTPEAFARAMMNAFARLEEKRS